MLQGLAGSFPPTLGWVRRQGPAAGARGRPNPCLAPPGVTSFTSWLVVGKGSAVWEEKTRQQLKAGKWRGFPSPVLPASVFPYLYQTDRLS